MSPPVPPRFGLLLSRQFGGREAGDLKAQAGETHERLVVDEVVSGSSNRSFGFTFAIGFTIVAPWPLMWGPSVRGWALIAAAAFLLAALALPRVLAPPRSRARSCLTV